MKLIGPFAQILPMDKLPRNGALSDSQLEIISDGGILTDSGKILEISNFAQLEKTAIQQNIEIERVGFPMVALPGFIDAHTHICWAGSRANDYAMRLEGKSYLDIANSGGGIWSTVVQTRKAPQEELSRITSHHANQMLKDGITTIEVKSGYGLTVDDELKILRAINQAPTLANLIPTCLAAHICPKDFEGKPGEYLEMMAKKLLPIVWEQELAKRVDIFIEDSAFNQPDAMKYLASARNMGFDIVVHGDQFSVGGSQTALELKALSVDHLEASNDETIKYLGKSNVITTVLPGASIGLGLAFAPARKLLDAGCSLAIASDWNPGSAPMGDLLIQAALLGIFENLTMAETLAGITYRAALALNLSDRGILKKGNIADIAAFKTNDFKEILYRQGKMKPEMVWKNGDAIN